jgi:protoporphyrinogen oxidase
MTAQPRILIVGAGPTGLGAAWRLQELGHENWLLIDHAGRAGGLAASVVDAQGFTWDHGGHVLFSHYRYFDRVMDTVLADWIEHEREAWVWMRDRWIPYPFQNNIWRLPREEVIRCIHGLLDVQGNHAAQAPELRHFGDWLQRAFGSGLCDIFMFPYNRKVWGYDPAQLDIGWMGERVARVDLKRIIENLVLQRDDVSWGPNATFRFPARGGTGAIWNNLYGTLAPSRCVLRHGVTSVLSRERKVQLADGSVMAYDWMISTQPLDRLLTMLDDQPELTALVPEFVHSSSHIVGIGLEGQPPESLRTKCWMYFPEPDTPFYRVTVFSNYSPNNVARPGKQWSLMCEVTEAPARPVDRTRVIDDVVAGVRRAGLLPAGVPIISTWSARLEYGYPTPWLGRDAVLNAIEPKLAAAGILSRGRFGAWKYEVSNQDHSLMQGVEAVDRILLGHQETTVRGIMGKEPPDAAVAAAAPALQWRGRAGALPGIGRQR